MRFGQLTKGGENNLLLSESANTVLQRLCIDDFVGKPQLLLQCGCVKGGFEGC
jgi:hypothetical protein